jgi:hypothetical protein
MEQTGDVVLAGDGRGRGCGCHHNAPDNDTRKALISDLIARALGQTLGTSGRHVSKLDFEPMYISSISIDSQDFNYVDEIWCLLCFQVSITFSYYSLRLTKRPIA